MKGFVKLKEFFNFREIGNGYIEVVVGGGSILASSPRLLNIGLKYSRVTNKYGYVMDYRRKMFAVERFSKYLKEGMEKLWIREQVEDRYEVSEDYRLYWRNLVVGLGEVEEYFLGSYRDWETSS